MRAIVVDTETTGIDPKKDRIVELAGLDLDSETSFEGLCSPGIPIPPEAMAVHHITEAMVEGAPPPEESIDYYIGIAGTSIHIAHNAPFDKAMLEAHGFPSDRVWIDTYQCAVHLFPDAPKHTNQVLRYYLNLDVTPPPGLAPHRALYDCYVTRALALRMLEEASIEDLIELSTKPALLRRVSFGMHQGKLWSDVPYGYLKWASQQDMGMNVAHTVAQYMKKPGWGR